MSTRDLSLLPKAHLHLHLTGSMRPATLAELGGVVVPVLSDIPDWSAFQSRYDAARSVIRRSEDVARVVHEAAADDQRDGCGWLEIQVDPTSYAPALGGLRETLEAVLSAASSAPIPVGVIVASSWARSGSHALELARLAAEYADFGVVGFGLSNDERLGRVEDFAPAFRIAADAGLLATPHSGFFTPASHVRACVEVLGASRIGHGTSAASDPSTLALLARRNIALEICPTSYPPLGVHALTDIPVVRLLDAGVPVAIASDDPLLFGVGLAGQYAICRDSLNLDDDQLAALARFGILASAAPPETKAPLLAGIDDWLGSTAG